MSGHLDPSLDRLDRSTFELNFTDDFTGAALDADRWVDHYLPHWTTPKCALQPRLSESHTCQEEII